jgi:hypothetical protein
VQNINEETLVYIVYFFWYVNFVIECTDVDAFIAALDFDLLGYFIRFFWLLLVERLLIVHYRLDVSFIIILSL